MATTTKPGRFGRSNLSLPKTIDVKSIAEKNTLNGLFLAGLVGNYPWKNYLRKKL